MALARLHRGSVVSQACCKCIGRCSVYQDPLVELRGKNLGLGGDQFVCGLRREGSGDTIRHKCGTGNYGQYLNKLTPCVSSIIFSTSINVFFVFVSSIIKSARNCLGQAEDGNESQGHDVADTSHAAWMMTLCRVGAIQASSQTIRHGRDGMDQGRHCEPCRWIQRCNNCASKEPPPYPNGKVCPRHGIRFALPITARADVLATLSHGGYNLLAARYNARYLCQCSYA